MKIKFLDYGEHEFDLATLRGLDWPDDLAPYQASVLQFCTEWLNGKETFSFQTSGSTGTPKYIPLNRNQLQLSAEETLKALGLTSGDSAFITINTNFIGGKMMLVRGIVGNLDVFICEPSSMPWKSLPEDQSIDFYSFVPFQLSTILEKIPESIKKINKAKAILIGGAPVGAKLESAIQSIESPVYHTYGMTETVSHIALKRLNGNAKREYFECLGETTVSIDPRECLVIHSPILNSALVTNDIAEIIDNKKFIWLGRADNVINTGGLKFQLENVQSAAEIALFGLREQNRSIAIGFPDEKLGERLELIIESKPFSEEKRDKLMKVLSEALDKYELPKAIRFIERFPETASGKIDKQKIIELLQSVVN